MISLWKCRIILKKQIMKTETLNQEIGYKEK